MGNLTTLTVSDFEVQSALRHACKSGMRVAQEDAGRRIEIKQQCGRTTLVGFEQDPGKWLIAADQAVWSFHSN